MLALQSLAAALHCRLSDDIGSSEIERQSVGSDICSPDLEALPVVDNGSPDAEALLADEIGNLHAEARVAVDIVCLHTDQQLVYHGFPDYLPV